MSNVGLCVIKHFGSNSPIAAYKGEMAGDVDDLVAGGMDKDAAWLQVIDAKLLNLGAEKSRIEQSVADAYGKTAAGKVAKPAAAPAPAPVATYPLAPTGTRYEETDKPITMMSPDAYLAAVRPLDIDDASRDNIEDLKQHILSGKTLDPLHIRADGKEDGRHRAVAAKELGIKQVPVVDERAVAGSAKAAPINTEDAGAELTYNRRNRVKSGIKWDDIANKNDALKVKEAVKQNVYPRPDYQALVDGGMQPIVAHLVKQAYDAISAKPNTRSAPTDAEMQTYIAGVNRVMTGVMAWANDAASVSKWAQREARSAGAMLGKAVNLSELASSGKTMLESVYPDGWKGNQAEVVVLGSNKLLGGLQPGYDETKRAIKAIGAGWPASQEAWEKRGIKVIHAEKIDVSYYEGKRSRTDEPYVSISYRVGGQRLMDQLIDGAESQSDPKVAAAVAAEIEAHQGMFIVMDKARRIVGKQETEEAAKDVARELTKREGKEGGPDDSGIDVALARREGPPRRLEGENVSSDKLKEAFSFKGVNFGNWMKGDTPALRAERQAHLNHAYDSFADLADLFGVPPKAMSLNGMLGLAIGAQGNGKYAAHFVPGVNEINLTRTSGAGSLAHEFGHALDHYFAAQAGFSKREEPFLTEHTASVNRKVVVENGRQRMVVDTDAQQIRPEIVDRFKAIVQAMNKKPETLEQFTARQAAAKENAKTSVARWLKSVRRDFVAKGVDEAAFDAIATRIMALDLGDGKIMVSPTLAVNPAVDELRALYRKKAGKVPPIEQIKGLQANVDYMVYALSERPGAVDHVPQQVSTDFANAAAGLDKDKGGKRYWSTNLEKFARAFDAFVSDELEAKAAKNTYLSHAGRTGETVPMGDERTAINAAIKSLVDTIQTRADDDGNVTMFSRAPQTESAAFKRWFGDSKVVDEAGEPLVVYHGSSADITTFKSRAGLQRESGDGRFGNEGIYFAEDPGKADAYAGRGQVYPVYLSIKNPLMVATGQAFNADSLAARIAKRLAPKLYARETSSQALRDTMGDSGAYISEIDKAELRRLGYDGIYSEADRVWIALDANQIKSAIGNSGEFDAGNPDIRYSRAGTTGIPMRDARAVAASIRLALPKAPAIIVHETIEQAPKALLDNIREAGAQNDVEAAYHDGAIHVFPQHLRSIERMEFVVAHHEIRHHGLRAILQDKFGPTMLAMRNSNPSLRAAAQAKIDAGLADSTVQSVDEALADMPMAELEKLTGFDKLVAAIRQWLRMTAFRLRKAGFGTVADAINPKEWTDRDVAAFVLKAEMVSRDGGPDVSAPGTVFGREAIGAEARDKNYGRWSEGIARSENTFQTGVPVIVPALHGGPAAGKIGAFDSDAIGSGMYGSASNNVLGWYFTSDTPEAAGYAIGVASDDDKTPGQRRAFERAMGGGFTTRGTGVIEADIKLKNPLVMPGDEFSKHIEADRKKVAALRDRLLAGGHDGIIVAWEHKGRGLDATRTAYRDAYESALDTMTAAYELLPEDKRASFEKSDTMFQDWLVGKSGTSRPPIGVRDAFRTLAGRDIFAGIAEASAPELPKGDAPVFRGVSKYWVVVTPEAADNGQIKDVYRNSGAFDTANPDIRYSRATPDATPRDEAGSPRTAQDFVKTTGGVFDFNRMGETKQDRVRAVVDKARPFWLGALTRDQIADMYGKEIPQIKDYDDLTRAMENERSSMAQKAETVYEEWAALPSELNDRLARMMLDATVFQVHPDKAAPPAKATEEQVSAHARLHNAWRMMPKEGQAMYAKVRDFHTATLTSLKTALEGRIDRLMANGAEKSAALTDIRARFDQYLKNGPYFPLTRFGDFLVIANRDDGERVVAAYESAGEQQAAARALEADGFAVKLKTAKTYKRSQDGSAGKFIGDVLTAIDKMDLAESGSSPAATKEQLLDDLNQLFIRALPDLSYRKHFMHRKNTPGFSADVMRGFASSAFYSASHIARLNHSDKMTFALDEAFKTVEAAPEGDFNQATQVLNEMASRHEAMLNPTAHPLSTLATQAGFVMYLGLSPAAGLINMLQVPMVALPYLGARYGFTKATMAMSKAYKDIMGAAPNRKSGFNAAQSPKLTTEERQAMSKLQDEGVIDLTQAHDLAAATDRDVGNQARSKASFAIARAMRIVGWTFHVPEVMNRQVTALMTYRMEIAKGAAVEVAMDAARDAIKRTQFDYSSSNRARYMQGNLARVVTQFKQFSQNMTYFLGRAAYQALKGEDPEVRSIARRQILSTFAVTGAMAGSLGLPGIGFFGSLIGALAGAMGDDDEPWDWKTEYRNMLADTFGKEAGEVLAKGVPRALMPWWDISNRVGLADLWWRSNDREGQNPRESFASDMGNILGPTAGTILGWYTAADHMQRGNYSKAAESVVPKFIRDPLKALREGTEGVTNYNGEPLLDTTAAEDIGRMFGFAPTRASEMYEARNAVMNSKTALEEKRQRLLSRIVKARMDGDRETEDELRSDIAGFNERNPAFKITGTSIGKAVMNKRRNRENTEDGIVLPKSKDALRDLGRFAVVE